MLGCLMVFAALTCVSLGVVIGCHLSRVRGYVASVRGDVDPWAIHSAAESAVKAYNEKVQHVGLRRALEMRVRRMAWIGVRGNFNAAAPWQPGVTAATVTRSGTVAWVNGDRDGLEDRVSTVVQHVLSEVIRG